MVSDKWKKLAAKDESIVVKGENITLKGLTFTELTELSAFEDRKNRSGAMNYILRVTLEKAPEVDDADIPWLLENIGAEAAVEILSKVQEISGLSDSSDKEKNE